MTDGEATAKALAQRMLDGFNSGDVASIADGFHPDVRAEFPFAPPGMPASQTGHNAVVAAFRDGRASIAEITIAPTSMRWCPDDSVLVVEAEGMGRLVNGADAGETDFESHDRCFAERFLLGKTMTRPSGNWLVKP